MEIKGFQLPSLIDWPGKIAAIMFLNHCNLRCRYCHNPNLARGDLANSNISPAYLLAKLYEKREWIDGLVLSGGEPTLNRDLPEFLRDIRSFLPKISIKLDTNGTNPNLLKVLLVEQLIDKVSLDIKAPLTDEDLYRWICQANVSTTAIEKSINLTLDAGCAIEFRTTVCPQLLTEEEIYKIACELACICNPVSEFTIQTFNSSRSMLDNTLKGSFTYSKEILEKLQARIKKDLIFNCKIK